MPALLVARCDFDNCANYGEIALERKYVLAGGALPRGLRRVLQSPAARSIWRKAAPLLPGRWRNAGTQFAAELTARPTAKYFAPDVVTRKPNLYWISAAPDSAEHIYRVARPLASAIALGTEATSIALNEIRSHLDDIEAADVLILWSAHWTRDIAAAVDAARWGGAGIILDVDQEIVDEKMARTIDAVDMCTVSTDRLAAHVHRLGKPALVVHSGFDKAAWEASRLAARQRASSEKDGFVRLGYLASAADGHQNLATCAPALAEVMSMRPECRLVLLSSVGDEGLAHLERTAAFRGLEDRIERRYAASAERLREELSRFDVNLAPTDKKLPGSERRSGECYLEATLVGVPTIASRRASYGDTLVHGQTGFLAETHDEWREALLALVENPRLRHRISLAARCGVLWPFGPERRRRDLSTVLDLMQSGPTAASAFCALAQPREPGPPQLPQIPEYDIAYETDRLAIADATIVISLYNYEHTILEALGSAKAQTIDQLDLVVVDDGSTDSSLEVALGWARTHGARFNRLVIARNSENQGLPATRNVGFALSETPWVMALDADNRLRPPCLSACLKAAEISGAAFAYPVIELFGSDQGVWGRAEWNPVRLCSGNRVDAMALISRAAWAAVGGYDSELRGWEDYDLWCSFAEKGFWGQRVGGEPLAEYRVHGTSMMRNIAADRERTHLTIKRLRDRHPWLTLKAPE